MAYYLSNGFVDARLPGEYFRVFSGR